MGTLRDEVYESLDYLSQLTEVMVAPQNEILARIPDRIPITIEDIQTNRYGSFSLHYGSPNAFIDINSVLYRNMRSEDANFVADLAPAFEFQVAEGTELDLENEVITGEIALVKRVQHLEEREILTAALRVATSHLSFDWPKKSRISRTVTILNTIESGLGQQWFDSGIPESPRQAICSALQSAILTNQWRVRNYDIIVKMGFWINLYMQHGQDGLGLVNLVKLKFMLNKDVPVYSIDEVKDIAPQGEIKSSISVSEDQ